MLPIALGMVDRCAQLPRSCSCFVLVRISRPRSTDTITRNARLASEIFWSSPQAESFNARVEDRSL
jgi:hypothetical protein